MVSAFCFRKRGSFFSLKATYVLIIAKSVAARLRKLTPRMQLKAKMKIEESILEAEETDVVLQHTAVYTNL